MVTFPIKLKSPERKDFFQLMFSSVMGLKFYGKFEERNLHYFTHNLEVQPLLNTYVWCMKLEVERFGLHLFPGRLIE